MGFCRSKEGIVDQFALLRERVWFLQQNPRRAAAQAGVLRFGGRV